MTVYLVGAGPGDPGLLTRRGAELLGRADVVVHDRLVDPGVLALVAPHAELVDVGKRPGVSGRQERINELLVERGRRGQLVVRLKGGDPFVFGRGGEEAEALLAAGVVFEVVPGVTSAFAAPAYAGVPVTYRGRATSVTVVTGHVGGPGATAGGVDWNALARAGGTLVILMGMEHRNEIAADLVAAGRPASTPVLVVQWGTTDRQRSARTTLAELGGVELGSPATIVVGEVAGLDLSWVQRRPLHGRSVVLTRPTERTEPLAQLLADGGAKVVSFPVTARAAPADGGAALREAAGRLPAYDWVAFTSAAAVEALMACLHDARALAGVRLAAVGSRTAEALGRHGLVADLVPPRASGAGLAEAMAPPAAEGARLLHPRAADGRPELADGLRRLGWEVDEVDAYRTVATTEGLDEERRRRASAADAVVLAAPSAAKAFADALRPLPLPPVAVCIGPTTAATAAALGWRAETATTPDAAALFALLVDALAGPDRPARPKGPDPGS